MSHALEAEHLAKRFGKRWAIDGLTLAVPEGSIHALLGPNGAGKTTTLKTAMNMYRPTLGRVHLLGVDSRRLGPAERQRIGYVSENQELPEWMSVGQLLAFCRRMYPTWDTSFCDHLRRFFELEGHWRIGQLSRGMKMKAALLSVLSYRPRLLIMDEPFAGLDVGVRDELIRGVLELSEDRAWTVFISSHDIDEVERLADQVTIMADGKAILTGPLSDLHQRFRRVEVIVGERTAASIETPTTWLGVERAAGRLTFVHAHYDEGRLREEMVQALEQWSSVNVLPMSLKEIFLALAHAYRLTREGMS